MNINNGILEISFSSHENRILYFSKPLLRDEYFLKTSSRFFKGDYSVKYGQYEYKVDKIIGKHLIPMPKLLVQFDEKYIREKTLEKEEGRKVQ